MNVIVTKNYADEVSSSQIPQLNSHVQLVEDKYIINLWSIRNSGDRIMRDMAIEVFWVDSKKFDEHIASWSIADTSVWTEDDSIQEKIMQPIINYFHRIDAIDNKNAERGAMVNAIAYYQGFKHLTYNNMSLHEFRATVSGYIRTAFTKYRTQVRMMKNTSNS